MSNTTIPAAQAAMLNTIHKVEGFDPSVYAIDYTDLNTGETRKRLPVMAQMTWFRLVYREGKIAVSVTAGTMNRSTPGLPVYRQLPEFTQTHIH